MAKKKKQKHPIIDKSPVRKKKAKGWVKTYTGTDIVKDYREHFKGVDVACAVRELQEIGYEFEPGYEKNVLKAEAVRIGQLHRKKEQNLEADEYNEWQDDNFFFIAGHTSGGAPYGVQWWEMGLEPWENIHDDIDDDDVIICYRHYESLNKRDKDLVDGRLRDEFSKFVNKHKQRPNKDEQQAMIEKVFESCPGGPLLYSKDFNKIYRKIIKKRENRFIREGILSETVCADSDVKQHNVNCDTNSENT
jgi:hypothetical protein